MRKMLIPEKWTAPADSSYWWQRQSDGEQDPVSRSLIRIIRLRMKCRSVVSSCPGHQRLSVWHLVVPIDEKSPDEIDDTVRFKLL